MTVMVPFSNVTNIGLRKITKNNEVSRVLVFLASGRCDCASDWKCRFKDNTYKMQSSNHTIPPDELGHPHKHTSTRSVPCSQFRVCHMHQPNVFVNRFKDNTDKMQSGSLLQVAEVLKGLLILQNEKPLSFREKKMLDRSRHLLVSELAIAKGVREPEAETLIERALHKADLNMPAVL
jgi:CarD family transcriptional regulator